LPNTARTLFPFRGRKPLGGSQMETKKFTISKWFVIANYFTIPGSFVFAIFFIFGPLFLWHSSLIEKVLYCIMGIGFFVCGIYSIKIVPQMKDTIHISESQIMREHSTDGTFTSIWWKENFTVRNRPFLGRLELISQDGQRVVMIEHQTEKFQEIYELINVKLIEKQNS
jgi:hypothetical protein